MTNIKIIKLPPKRWLEYKVLKLEALKNEPTAFISSYEDKLKEQDTYWQQKAKQLFEGKTSIGFFAEVQNTLIGSMALNLNRESKAQHRATVVAAYVNPVYQGQGIATMLMEAIILEASKRPELIKLDLDVNTQNKKAINLYKKFGFQIVGTYHKDLKVEDKYYDLYEMEKLL